MEYINVNELLTGQTALPVPETVEDAAPLSHSFQFFCWIANQGYVLGQFSFNLNVECYISGRYLEYLLSECPKARAGVITITNQSKGRLRNQCTLKVQTIQAQSLTRRKMRVIKWRLDFGLVPDWLIGWHRFLDWSERE